MKTIQIYTDGACSGNPGPGGWAAIILDGTDEKVLSGGDPHTTNNRMELTAVIKALEVLDEPFEVELYSDSKYVTDGLEKGWAEGWKARDWVKSDGNRACNIDLWDQLLKLCGKHRVNSHWVESHSGNPDSYNERCDKLAVEESKKYL